MKMINDNELRNVLAEILGTKYGCEMETNEDDDIIIRGYDWEAGCFSGSEWLSLYEVIEALVDELPNYVDIEY